jgi:hypothetical protein
MQKAAPAPRTAAANNAVCFSIASPHGCERVCFAGRSRDRLDPQVFAWMDRQVDNSTRPWRPLYRRRPRAVGPATRFS